MFTESAYDASGRVVQTSERQTARNELVTEYFDNGWMNVQARLRRKSEEWLDVLVNTGGGMFLMVNDDGTAARSHICRDRPRSITAQWGFFLGAIASAVLLFTYFVPVGAIWVVAGFALLAIGGLMAICGSLIFSRKRDVSFWRVLWNSFWRFFVFVFNFSALGS